MPIVGALVLWSFSYIVSWNCGDLSASWWTGWQIGVRMAHAKRFVKKLGPAIVRRTIRCAGQVHQTSYSRKMWTQLGS